MANALGAVNAALRPIAAILRQGNVVAGQPVTLQGGGSAAACTRMVDAYRWTVVSSTGAPPTISNANTATASVPAPLSGNEVIRLTVTDDAGRTDMADITITPASSSQTAPTNAGNKACLTAISVPQTSDVTVQATDPGAAEEGLDPGTFTFRRTGGDVSDPLAVTIAISGTATKGTDYQALPTTVNFAAGAPTTTLSVTPTDDMAVETGGETVTVTLVDGAAYDVGSQAAATVTIADNEMAPAPPPTGGGGGGGGAMDVWTVLVSALGVAAASLPGRRKRRSLHES
jgi:hypothetical protein